MADQDADGIPQRTFRRSARLARVPLGVAGRAAAGWGRRLAGTDSEQAARASLEHNAEQLFAVLGNLKGGAMKLGQTLGVFESMMPAEVAEPYHRALTRLQTTSTAMPTATVYRMLDEQFGRGWRNRVAEFDDEATAAASIGQIHRAVWHDGREVAVKVQYPGADTAVNADLRQLEWYSGLLTMLLPGLDAKTLLRELRERTLEELDYRIEADHQRRFAEALADDPDVQVPNVVASAPKAMVSEWLDGTPLSALIHTPATTAEEQADRDRRARMLVELLFSSPARVGLLHADPHPGNVLLRADGGLGLVDFGAVARLPQGIPEVLGIILRHAADGQADQMSTLLHTEGFVTGQVTPAQMLAWIGTMADPLRYEQFTFTHDWMRSQGRILNPYSAKYRTTGSLNLPPQYLQIVRVTGGWMNVLAQIECIVAARPIAERWLPGFATS